MNIVAIGGGTDVPAVSNFYYQELIRLSGKPSPHILFIPTASGDSPDYVLTVESAVLDLGCTFDSLLLHVDQDPAKICEADIVYVGGGNTKMMLDVWRAHGVDRLLRDHAETGKPLGGVSAGAICWFRVGNSDWPQYEGIPGVNTARLDCLGWIDLVMCPHTKNEGFRLTEFRAMMRTEHGVGIGVDDGCAMQISGDSYRILAPVAGGVAHRIEWLGGVLHEDILAPHEDFRPLDSLAAQKPSVD